MTSSYNNDEELGRLKEEEDKKINEEYQEVTNPKDPKLLGSQLLDSITNRLTGVGQSIIKASEDDPDSWTDDAVRLGLGGAKNVGNVLNAPGIKQSLQVLGAPAWVVGQGLGWTLEKAGVDPRYGHIAGEVGEWFIPFYGAGKLLKKTAQGTKLLTKAKHLNKYDDAVDAFKTGQRYMEQEFDLPTNILQRVLQTPDEASYLRTQIVNAIKYGPPSSSLDELDLLKNQPFFKALDPAEQTRLIEDFPYLTEDMIRPVGTTLPRSFRQTLGSTSVGKTIRRRLLDDTDVLRYSEMREASVDLPGAGRDWLQAYMTQSADDLTTFGQLRTSSLPKLREDFAELIEAFPDLGRQVQIHHIAALKATMGIFDGLQKGSPLYKDVADVLLKHIPGLGDETSNLLGVIGASKKAGTPHGLVHAFYREIIGEAGELFFTPEVLARMRYDRAFRLQKADELGRIIGESENIVKTAMEQLKKTQTPDITLYDVLRKVSKKDFIRSLDLPTQPRQDPLYRKPRLDENNRKQLIEKAIYQETRDFYDKIDPNMLKDQNLSTLYDMQRVINREFTELTIRLENLQKAKKVESAQAQRMIRQLSSTRDRQILIDKAIKKLEY